MQGAAWHCSPCLLLGIILLILAGQLPGQAITVQEISRFAFTSHDMASSRESVIQYPYVYMPNSYGFQVAVWDSVAGTFTEIANYGVPGSVTQMAAWQNYLFLAVSYGSFTDVQPDFGSLYKVDISDPWHPQPAGQLNAGPDNASYGNLLVVNGVMLARTDVEGLYEGMALINPADLSLIESQPGLYHFEVVRGQYVVTRPQNSTPFLVHAVDPVNGLTTLGSLSLTHYVANTFPGFMDLGGDLVGTQCGEGIRLWDAGDPLNWVLQGMVGHPFSAEGKYCNGLLVGANYEPDLDLTRFYVYDLADPANPVLLNSCDYPPGLGHGGGVDRLTSYGSFMFHCNGVDGSVCLKLLPAGDVVMVGSCYRFCSTVAQGRRSGNYALQPFYQSGLACFDISVPQAPQYAFTLFPDYQVGVHPSGDYLLGHFFPVDGGDFTERIYNISDLANPVLVSSFPYNMELTLFFDPDQSGCFYKLDRATQSVLKYQITDNQASLVLSHPLGVQLQSPTFVNGVLYLTESSGGNYHSLYSFAGFPANDPQPPVVVDGVVPAPGWVYYAGDYLFVRNLLHLGPYCSFYSPQSTFQVANEIFGFHFLNFACVGGEIGVSFYDYSGFPSGIQQEDFFLPQCSYTTYLDWDENYLYLFASDNISIYSYELGTGTDEPTPPPAGNLACYPNPFGAQLNIELKLAQPGDVSLEVFNLRGQSVRKLIPANLKAGTFSASWDGRDSAGKPAANGVYLLRATSAEGTQTRRVLLRK